MKIYQMELEDFFEIKQNLEAFWGDRYPQFIQMHHSMLFYEFGKTAYVIRSEGKVIAYLMGLLSQTSEKAYVHLIAVKFDFRKRNCASSLYNHFIRYSKSQGYKKVKAVTSPLNTTSIKFHQKIGMVLLGEKNKEGITVVRNYSGPGEELVVFEKSI